MNIPLFLQQDPRIILCLSAGLGLIVGLFAWVIFFRGFYKMREGGRRRVLLWFSVLSIGVFGFLMASVLQHNFITQWDQAAISFLQPIVTLENLHFLAVFTKFGGGSILTIFSVLIALILLLKRNGVLLITWVVAVAGSTIITQILKYSVERPRPAYNQQILHESSWSFPSGHASGTMAVIGMLMYFLIRYSEKSHYKILILCLGWAWIITIMASRVMLQVHYPSDVIAGAAVSAAWIFLCAAWYEYRQKQYFYS